MPEATEENEEEDEAIREGYKGRANAGTLENNCTLSLSHSNKSVALFLS